MKSIPYFSILPTFLLLAFSTLITAFPIPLLGLDLPLSIPKTAIRNLNETPFCAKKCIFNPHWTQTYAPEVKDLGYGHEYGNALCLNYVYQHMLDNCFKENCSPAKRAKVATLAEFRLTNL